jgi:hypothetical protein
MPNYSQIGDLHNFAIPDLEIVSVRRAKTLIWAIIYLARPCA